MNGDVLTTLDYRELIRNHIASGSDVTIATYRREVKIDFGVIEAGSDDLLTGYVEKPRFDYLVSMGVYCFKSSVLKRLTPGGYCDFPDLVKSLLAEGRAVSSYPFDGYWLDMGRPDDYATAVEEFETRRREFLPDEDASQ
jgi:NDP-sugar pyrophosphorylase family protein